MKRLVIICEGEAEQAFCKNVLSVSLESKGIYVSTPLIKKSMGGIVSWKNIKGQIIKHLRENAYVTTFIDLYGIQKRHAFPGWEDAMKQTNKYQLIDSLESAITDDVANEKFIPYIQLHEYEALLFSDDRLLKNVLPEGELKDEKELESIIREFPNPELINNGVETSPSHRIQNIIPAYNKVVYGSCIAEEIGLARIRQKCKHFNKWITRLEAL